MPIKRQLEHSTFVNLNLLRQNALKVNRGHSIELPIMNRYDILENLCGDHHTRCNRRAILLSSLWEDKFPRNLDGLAKLSTRSYGVRNIFGFTK
jgi:hypothetical protein